MAYLNQSLWQSAYLITFCTGEEVEDAFTFSVPPQNEDFNYLQRVNETKTFGGSVIEDYGNDTVQISLSGTTINQQLKIIYRAELPRKFMSGEEEVFYLKNLFEKWGKADKLKNKKVYLYCLNKGKIRNETNEKRWRIWVQSFSIKRNKDKPLTYDYTLKAIGVHRETTQRKIPILKELSELYVSINKKITDIQKFIYQANYYLGDALAAITSNLEELNLLLSNFTNLTTAPIEGITDVFTETTVLGLEVGKVITYPAALCIKINSACVALDNSMNDFMKVYNAIVYDKSYITKAAMFNNLSKEDLTDAWRKLVKTAKRDTDAFITKAKKEITESNTIPLVVPANSSESNDSIILASGYSEYKYTQGDTWASIASKFYSDASYSTMLQLYNSDVDIYSLTPGTVVYIPKLSNDINESNNEVYTDYGKKDLYGTDCKIENNDFAIKNGDLSLTGGTETINQAIENRLKTSINSRVRNVVYGIRVNSGLPADGLDAAAVYITSSIEQTILADPRIENIESIEWEGKGEHLLIDVVYKTVTGNIQKYGGLV